MANVAHPGLFPSHCLGGGTITYERRRVLTNNTYAIEMQGAVVSETDGGTVGLAKTGQHTSAIDSVAMGASYVNASGYRVGDKQLPASTTYTTEDNRSYVFVVSNVPDVVFRGSIDEAIVQAGLFLNYSLQLAAVVNGTSAQEIDATSPNTTSTIPLRVRGFVVASDNDEATADAHVFCMINGQTIPALNLTGL